MSLENIDYFHVSKDPLFIPSLGELDGFGLNSMDFLTSSKLAFRSFMILSVFHSWVSSLTDIGDEWADRALDLKWELDFNLDLHVGSDNFFSTLILSSKEGASLLSSNKLSVLRLN